MSEHLPRKRHSEDCCEVDRRQFLQTAGVLAGGASLAGVVPLVGADEKVVKKPKATAESHVKALFKALTPEQKDKVCFEWDFKDPKRGLLRTRVSNNWSITEPQIIGEFYTDEQRDIIRSIFVSLYSPDWLPKIEKQLKDDAGGYGKRQSLAIFGDPDEGRFEFVMTGRHLTIRCDGNSADHVAFAGPIFYGHAAQGFDEKPDHPGNVFWPQAMAANGVFEMLDGKQRKKALVTRRPAEAAVSFRGPKGPFPGIRIADFSADQKEEMQRVLKKLIEPYRKADQQEALKCLKQQGGLDACSLAFYQEADLGDDGVWDNWRLEGPSFVWYFRGAPHVHVWANIASSHEVKLNAQG